MKAKWNPTREFFHRAYIHHPKWAKSFSNDKNSFNRSIQIAFINRFGMRPDKVVGRVVTIDGITFLVTLREDNKLLCVQVRGICPRHGEKVFSKRCYQDWEIGEMLVNFQVDKDHMCKLK